jgi:hypothetical protein
VHPWNVDHGWKIASTEREGAFTTQQLEARDEAHTHTKGMTEPGGRGGERVGTKTNLTVEPFPDSHAFHCDHLIIRYAQSLSVKSINRPPSHAETISL